MDTIPEKGKRYNIKSRPWDASYLDIIESEEGDWIYDPINSETDSETEYGYGNCPDCGWYKEPQGCNVPRDSPGCNLNRTERKEVKNERLR